MKTFSAKKNATVRKWVLIDLKGKTLGRAATEIANILRGKHRVTFTPHVDTGDFVVAINANKIKMTGKKVTEKMYYRHSGYMGGLKERSAKTLLARRPDYLIRVTVKGMLPMTHLAKKMLRKLKIYADAKHPHTAQFPSETAAAN